MHLRSTYKDKLHTKVSLQEISAGEEACETSSIRLAPEQEDSDFQGSTFLKVVA